MLRAPWDRLCAEPGLWLAAGELAPVADLAAARAQLLRMQPDGAEQAATRAAILAFVDEHPADAHSRGLLAGHLTASALVVDPARGPRGRALLTQHKKLGRWLQLGGHCDGDANLAGAALREAIEESGIADLRVWPTPLDVDIHAIPARPGEPRHLHLDTRFVVLAPPRSACALSQESSALGWFGPDELAGLGLDGSVLRLFARVFA